MSYTIELTVNFSASQNFTVAVESYSFGATESVTISGGGVNLSKTSFTPLTIIKMLDANTTALFYNLATERGIPKVTLTLTKAGNINPNQPDLTYTLEGAFITEIADSGSGHGGTFPMQQIIFVFEKIQITTGDGHTLPGGSQFTYDVTTGFASIN